MVGSGAVLPSACNEPAAIPAVMFVAALPMSICPQAMSCARPSRDNARVRPVIACLETVYGVEFGRGTCAESDPLLMILPPLGDCPAMRRKASRAQRNAPVTFTAITEDQSSRLTSDTAEFGAAVPALLNSKSIRPNRATA